MSGQCLFQLFHQAVWLGSIYIHAAVEDQDCRCAMLDEV